MTSRVAFWVVPLVVALAVAAAAGAGPVAKTYRDAAGDVRRGGPDITSVVVSNDARSIAFTVRCAQAPPLDVSAPGASAKWVDMLLVGIDVPPLGPAPVPARWRGVDYYFGLHGNDLGTAQFARTGVRKRTRLPVVVRGASLTVRVPRAKLGDPAWFGFTLAAGREAEVEAQGSADFAPAKGVFRYVLTA